MSSDFLKFRRYATRPPNSLIQALKNAGASGRLLTRRDIRGGLFAVRKIMQTGLGTKTTSFQQSRFTPTTVIWRKKQRSCGSYTTVVASVTRWYGLRCKLIDGYLGVKKAGHHHAWNEIYIPDENKFVAFDITRPSLRIGKRHRRVRAWADWHELEKVYDPKSV